VVEKSYEVQTATATASEMQKHAGKAKPTSMTPLAVVCAGYHKPRIADKAKAVTIDCLRPTRSTSSGPIKAPPGAPSIITGEQPSEETTGKCFLTSRVGIHEVKVYWQTITAVTATIATSKFRRRCASLS